jgi:hypothetical protein
MNMARALLGISVVVFLDATFGKGTKEWLDDARITSRYGSTT